jgi:hypothetical protein
MDASLMSTKNVRGLRRGEKENPKKKERAGFIKYVDLESGPTKVQYKP